MTDEVYKKATELNKVKHLLKSVNHIMSFPYPELNISYKNEQLCVDFVDLDKKTKEELTEAILSVVSKRKKEIDEEYKAL